MSDRSYSSYDDFDDDTWTPLYYAAINNYIDATKLLLELGADPRYKYKGQAPVFRSIIRHKYHRVCGWYCDPDDKVLKMLLEYKDPMTGRICGKLSPPNITHWRLDIYDGGCDGY